MSLRLQNAPLAAGWRAIVDAFVKSAEGRHLTGFLDQRHATGAVIYPEHPLAALERTPLADVCAVIVGQDPYHGPGQAHGLAFSVPPGVPSPPSLRNIFKELQRDLGLPPPTSGSLERWAERGVLLLNTSLTVEQGRPASHAGQGWQSLTDSLLTAVASRGQPCVYLLWGTHAQGKAGLIEAASARSPGGRASALLLAANHPSPLSANRPPLPFIGCGHFSIAQRWLAQHGLALDWSLQPSGQAASSDMLSP